MRRSLSRVAWYFGLRWGDPEFEEHPPSRPRPLWLLAVGSIVSGLVFALITEALGGFDSGLVGFAAKALVWAVLMFVFHFIRELRGRRDVAIEQPLRPTSSDR